MVTLEFDTPSPVWTATGRNSPDCSGAITLILVSLAVVYWLVLSGEPSIRTLDTREGYKPVPLIVKLFPALTQVGLTLVTTGLLKGKRIAEGQRYNC